MIQKKYIIHGKYTFEDMVRDVKSQPMYASASDRVLLMFESENDTEQIAAHLAFLKENLSDVKVFGMTLLGKLKSDMILAEQTTFCSLMLFETSRVQVVGADTADVPAKTAAADFLNRVDRRDLKGILFLTGIKSTQPSDYLEIVAEELPHTPIFGAQAGSKKLNSDQFYVFCGAKIYQDGAVAAAFNGEDLEIETDQVLGWKPLGREHQVTKVSENGLVETIDKKPAMALYEKYLGLKPDANFYANNAAFPLLEQTGNMMSARIPFDFNEQGAIRFFTPMPEGARVSLSYSRRGMLLEHAFNCAKWIASFKPEAMILITCLNRRLLLGNADSDLELSYFTQVAPQAIWGYGGSEILQTGRNGGILNSSIVAVAFREGAPKAGPPVRVNGDKLEDESDQPIELSDRLVTFLEQTTAELHEVIDKLQVIASHDQLTGLANRRLLSETTNGLIEREKAGEAFSALMYDVDYFKKVNDTFGHKAGDAILCEITEVVKKQIRRSDMLGRWGGEEFVCLFQNASLTDATYIAERVRWAVDQHRFAHVGHITISIGVVTRHEGETEEAMFIRLDRMLYQAKNGGRNRVVTEAGKVITSES